MLEKLMEESFPLSFQLFLAQDEHFIGPRFKSL